MISKKTAIILSFIFASFITGVTFAKSTLDETTSEFYAQNNILFYEPCAASGSGICGDNKDYEGNQVWTDEQMGALEANQPFYEKAAQENDIPWQLIAVIHLREHGLARDNPGNGQGPYQFASSGEQAACTALNGASFSPGPLSDEEFQKHTDCAGKFIKEKYGGNYDLNTDDGVKNMFFSYNGRAQAYIRQALDLGFSQEEAENGEGSPYVMNKYDEKRDPNKNGEHWGQIKTDGGSISYPANQDYGAFVLYKAIADCGAGSSESGKYDCNEGGGNAISQQAINLAWPEGTEGGTPQTPKPEFVEAAKQVGTDYSGPDCGKFVATVILSAGVDPDFPKSYTGNQLSHMSGSSLWQEVDSSQESNLMPGDVLVNDQHIEIYLGESKTAEASLSDPAYYSVIHNSSFGGAVSNYKAFRLKSSNSALSQTNSGIQCGCVDTSGGLKDGGYSTVEEAEQAIIVPYNNDPLSDPFFSGLPSSQEGGIHANCVAFTEWFLFANTNIDFGGQRIFGDGGQIAGNFYNRFKDSHPELTMSSTPSVYSIASWQQGEMRNATSSAGHTGVVVGINQAANKVLIAEAGYGNPGFTGVHEYTIDELNGHGQYVNINAYMKGAIKK